MLLAALVMVAAPGAARAAGEPNEVKLTSELLPDPQALLTNARISYQNAFSIRSGKGSLMIGGSTIAIQAEVRNGIHFIGIDLNKNGTVEPSEYAPVPASRCLVVKLKAPGEKKETALSLEDVVITQSQSNEISGYGHCFAACCLKAQVNGATVRLIDDNNDGQITQDGKDSIIVGNTPCAMPLFKTHQIGSAICDLTVASDGSTLSWSKASDANMGIVECPLMKSAALKALILVDEAKGVAFDVVAGKASIPAGNYKLAYGFMTQGQEKMKIRPAAKPLTYTIEPDMANTIRLGPTMHLEFGGTFTSTDVKVNPPLVEGIGGEIYEVDWKLPAARPSIALLEGTKVLSQDSMEYG